MVTVLSSIFTVPLRATAVALLFGEADTVTVPLPVPPPPVVIHEADGIAVQEQAFCVFMLIDIDPPSGLIAFVLFVVAL